MSTSNIKTPIIPRVGYLQNWTNSNKSDLIVKSFVECELNKLNLFIVRYESNTNTLSLYYYRWLQRAFIPLVRRKSKKQLASNVEIGHLLQPNLNTINNFKVFFNRRGISKFNRLKKHYLNCTSYILPNFVLYQLNNKLSLFSTNHILLVHNIYKYAKNQNIAIVNCLDFSFRYPQLRRWSNFKFYLDAIVVYNMIFNHLCFSNTVVNLIKQSFTRNSKKGQQRLFLVYLQKLPILLKNFVNKSNNLQNLNRQEFVLIIVVNGKFMVTGRTQKFKIQPKKLPLHSLNVLYDYSEGFVNTKAGTFSVKVWCYKL